MDARESAAADLERLIRAHQPDEEGFCVACVAAGDLARYPCEPRLLCERAAAALARRRSRADGTAPINGDSDGRK